MIHTVYHARITETLSPHSYEMVWILQKKELINNWRFERSLAWASAESFHKIPPDMQTENLMLAL